MNGQASQPKDQLVDELLGLEKQRLSATPLGAASQARYRQLVRTLFGGAEDDRRRFVRVDARRPARIQHAGFELPAQVTSMSVGGLFLHTEEPDPALMGKEVDVVVELHHVEKHPISLRARVCRVASAPDQAQGFGVELLDLDAQQRDSLANQLKEQLLAALQASEEQYRFFFEHSSDVALLLDRGGHVQQVSEAGASLLGCTRDTLSGAHLDALVALDDLPRATEALEKLEEQNSVRIEIELLDRNGGRIPVLATFQAVRAHSLCVGSIVAADDLRERKRREQEQRTMERRLFQMDKLATLGQVTAGIAHDINNPLAYMLSNLTVLEQNLDGLVEAVGAARSGRVASMTPKALESLNGSLPELIGDSLEGCRRIRDIIKQLRDFSRVDNSAEIPVERQRRSRRVDPGHPEPDQPSLSAGARLCGGSPPHSVQFRPLLAGRAEPAVQRSQGFRRPRPGSQQNPRHHATDRIGNRRLRHRQRPWHRAGAAVPDPGTVLHDPRPLGGHWSGVGDRSGQCADARRHAGDRVRSGRRHDFFFHATGPHAASRKGAPAFRPSVVASPAPDLDRGRRSGGAAGPQAPARAPGTRSCHLLLQRMHSSSSVSTTSTRSCAT